MHVRVLFVNLSMHARVCLKTKPKHRANNGMEK